MPKHVSFKKTSFMNHCTFTTLLLSKFKHRFVLLTSTILKLTEAFILKSGNIYILISALSQLNPLVVFKDMLNFHLMCERTHFRIQKVIISIVRP